MSATSSLRLCVFASLRFVFCVLLLSHPALAQKPVRFVDVTTASGITWRHENGATPDKYMIETMGGGGAFLDYDGDGLLDIFLVNSGPTRVFKPKTPPRHALYRNRGNGTFEDVTAKSGAGGNGAFGMGVAVGDVDNDGRPDIYVTAFGGNQLLRNKGDGTFEDITAKSGTGLVTWSTSAAFFDYDKDGRLDLFVCNYCDWSPDNNKLCGGDKPETRAYCHPDVYNGLPSTLFRNLGDGRFEDVSKKSGVAGPPSKGLGVVTADYDGDGWTDVFVANDAVQNFLFRNKGDGTFEEIALLAEIAYATVGKPQSGMGTDAADFDGNGLPDFVVTNLDQELNTIYRNNGDGSFSDVTIQTGLGSTSLLQSGFGAKWVDVDNDGDVDLFVANGHILDNIAKFKEGVTYAEAPFLIENLGKGRLRDATAEFGKDLATAWVARGLASGDVDNDGDLDLLMINNGQRPVLLRNEGGSAAGSWIGLALEGIKSNRDGVGARVTVEVGGRKIVREVVGGGSYCAAHDPRLLVGVGPAPRADRVEVRWPSGTVDVLTKVEPGRYLKVLEGSAPPKP
jgi:hypothetical protein